MSQQAIWMFGGSLFTCFGVIAGAITRELMAEGRQSRQLRELEANQRAARNSLDVRPKSSAGVFFSPD